MTLIGDPTSMVMAWGQTKARPILQTGHFVQRSQPCRLTNYGSKVADESAGKGFGDRASNPAFLLEDLPAAGILDERRSNGGPDHQQKLQDRRPIRMGRMIRRQRGELLSRGYYVRGEP